MLEVKKNVINITRGDTAVLNISVSDANGENYSAADDTMVLTVKKSYTSEELISVTAVNGVITLQPSDTASLDFGSYLYDVQLTTANGDVHTIITPTQFIVCGEVHVDVTGND